MLGFCHTGHSSAPNNASCCLQQSSDCAFLSARRLPTLFAVSGGQIVGFFWDLAKWGPFNLCPLWRSICSRWVSIDPLFLGRKFHFKFYLRPPRKGRDSKYPGRGGYHHEVLSLKLARSRWVQDRLRRAMQHSFRSCARTKEVWGAPRGRHRASTGHTYRVGVERAHRRGRAAPHLLHGSFQNGCFSSPPVGSMHVGRNIENGSCVSSAHTHTCIHVSPKIPTWVTHVCACVGWLGGQGLVA